MSFSFAGPWRTPWIDYSSGLAFNAAFDAAPKSEVESAHEVFGHDGGLVQECDSLTMIAGRRSAPVGLVHR